mmetsp:Transcript_46924/g.118767  ORF Transcript_46924/g.118767 Transcript_46924/m.118767 type:complete len:270 (-) Transcript_46924:1064-1873(-)
MPRTEEWDIEFRRRRDGRRVSIGVPLLCAGTCSFCWSAATPCSAPDSPNTVSAAGSSADACSAAPPMPGEASSSSSHSHSSSPPSPSSSSDVSTLPTLPASSSSIGSIMSSSMPSISSRCCSRMRWLHRMRSDASMPVAPMMTTASCQLSRMPAPPEPEISAQSGPVHPWKHWHSPKLQRPRPLQSLSSRHSSVGWILSPSDTWQQMLGATGTKVPLLVSLQPPKPTLTKPLSCAQFSCCVLATHAWRSSDHRSPFSSSSAGVQHSTAP